MMWYVIVSQDVSNSQSLRMKARSAHVARLEELAAKGRLLVAGPNPAVDSDDPGAAGFTGSVVIADFASLDDASAWANDDPYVEAGVYHSVSVKPFNLVLP
jgi:uncharacterized protein YciI